MSYLKYPIRYAVMPVKSDKDWLKPTLANSLSEDVGFIVSKVYLLGERKTNFFNGKCRTEYEVVYPYKTPMDLDKRVIPQYGYTSFYSNSDFVDEIFATYEGANESATLKNKKLKQKLVKSLVCTEKELTKQVNEIDIDFDKKQEKYKEFESIILIMTEDLLVEIDDVYVKLSDFAKLYDDLKRELTIEEREKLLKNLWYKSEVLKEPKVLQMKR